MAVDLWPMILWADEATEAAGTTFDLSDLHCDISSLVFHEGRDRQNKPNGLFFETIWARFSMRIRTASCSCGQLSIEVQGEPLGVGVCHCLACQRRTGSVFAALAGFATPYEVSGTATEYVRVGDQGAKFTFRFCPICGTTVFHTEEGHEQSFVSVAVGAFADPSFPAPQDSVYNSRKHAWVQLPPGIQTYDTDPS
jgi:hypothetical protein